MSDASDSLRSHLDAWTRGICAKNLDEVMGHYAEDLVTFEWTGHSEGKAAARESCAAWFATFAGPIGLERRDLRIVAEGDIGASHSLDHIHGTTRTGQRAAIWVRSTMLYRRENGRWQITHRHTSAPFDATTFKASFGSELR